MKQSTNVTSKPLKKASYNYIKEEQDPVTQETIPRKYFSGGMGFDGAHLALAETFTSNDAVLPNFPSDLAMITAGVNPVAIGNGITAQSTDFAHNRI